LRLGSNIPTSVSKNACKVFITNRESAELAPATLWKYRTFTKQIATCAERRGYVMLDQFTPADIDLFWADWKLGARAKRETPPHTARCLPVLRQSQVDS
jgi:hypothetical protein